MLVYKIANRYYTESINAIDKEDLMQEGYLGLIRAAELYDFNNEYKASFATYAFQWINSKINRFIRTRNTNEESSLNQLVGEEEATELQDILPGFNGDYSKKLIEYEFKREIAQWINKTLSLKESQVIKCRYGFYGEAYSLNDTAEALSIPTEQDVKNIQNKSLRKLRQTSYARKYIKQRQAEQIQSKFEFNHTEEAALLKIEYEQFLKDLSTSLNAN